MLRNRVYNVSQLPKRLLYASGDPRDESLFKDSSLKTIVWSTECMTKGDVMIVSGKEAFYSLFKPLHAEVRMFVVVRFDSNAQKQTG
jgi:hypothetical protein